MEVGNSTTSNLASTLATLVLRFPSHILNRLRQLDNPWGDLVEQPSSNPGYRTTTAETNSRLHRRLRDTAAMPGPLGFASSGYFLGVIFMVSECPLSSVISTQMCAQFRLSSSTVSRISSYLLGMQALTTAREPAALSGNRLLHSERHAGADGECGSATCAS